MVFLNYTSMQVTAKIVYYGPGLCGKTTNLLWIHRKTAPGSRGEMISLETETDRTLFFDLLPLEAGVIGGMKVRLQVYTVPGQVFYNTTRRLVLKGVDGVVFVADSQIPSLDANQESVANLRQNLVELGADPAEVPVVFQYNKRDLPHVLPVPDLQRLLNPGGAPSFEAAALHGVGVFETLKEVSRLTLETVRARIAEDQSRTRVRRKKAPAVATPARTRAAVPPRPPESQSRSRSQSEHIEISFDEEDPSYAEEEDPATAMEGLLDATPEPEKPANGFSEIEKMLDSLRETSSIAASPSKATVVREVDVESMFSNLIAPASSGSFRSPLRPPPANPAPAAAATPAEHELDEQAVIEVPQQLLSRLTGIRFDLGLEQSGKVELRRDAVRVELVRSASLKRLRLRLDLELRGK